MRLRKKGSWKEIPTATIQKWYLPGSSKGALARERIEYDGVNQTIKELPKTMEPEVKTRGRQSRLIRLYVNRQINRRTLTLKEPGEEESARINFDGLALRVEQSWGCQT